MVEILRQIAKLHYPSIYYWVVQLFNYISFPACITSTVLIFLIGHQGEKTLKNIGNQRVWDWLCVVWCLFFFFFCKYIVLTILDSVLSEIFVLSFCQDTLLLGRILVTYLLCLYTYFTFSSHRIYFSFWSVHAKEF